MARLNNKMHSYAFHVHICDTCGVERDYYHVLEARRAAKLMAHAAGMRDEHAIDAVASKAGRYVSEHGSINSTQIETLIREALVS